MTGASGSSAKCPLHPESMSDRFRGGVGAEERIEKQASAAQNAGLLNDGPGSQSIPWSDLI